MLFAANGYVVFVVDVRFCWSLLNVVVCCRLLLVLFADVCYCLLFVVFWLVFVVCCVVDGCLVWLC